MPISPDSHINVYSGPQSKNWIVLQLLLAIVVSVSHSVVDYLTTSTRRESEYGRKPIDSPRHYPVPKLQVVLLILDFRLICSIPDNLNKIFGDIQLYYSFVRLFSGLDLTDNADKLCLL